MYDLCVFYAWLVCSLCTVYVQRMCILCTLSTDSVYCLCTVGGVGSRKGHLEPSELGFVFFQQVWLVCILSPVGHVMC